MSDVPPPQVAAAGNRSGQADIHGFKGWLEAIVALIGVTAALLPIEGVLTRWVSFGLAELQGSFQAPSATVASSASVPDLALTGLAGVWIPAYFLVLGMGVSAFLDDWRPFSKHWRIRVIVVCLVLIAAPIAVDFVDLVFFWIPPGGPFNWVVQSVAVDAGVLFGLWLWNQSDFSTTRLLVLAGFFAIFCAVVAGLVGNPANIEPVSYTFQTQQTQLPQGQTPRPNGTYVALGRADGATYIQSCQDMTIHQVTDVQVVDAKYVAPAAGLAQPSVWELITRGKIPVFGYRPVCANSR